MMQGEGSRSYYEVEFHHPILRCIYIFMLFGTSIPISFNILYVTYFYICLRVFMCRCLFLCMHKNKHCPTYLSSRHQCNNFIIVIPCKSLAVTNNSVCDIQCFSFLKCTLQNASALYFHAKSESQSLSKISCLYML